MRPTDLLWSWGCWKERGCPNTNGLWTREEGGFAASSKMEGAGRLGRDWMEFNMALSWSPAVGKTVKTTTCYSFTSKMAKSMVLYDSQANETVNKAMPIQKRGRWWSLSSNQGFDSTCWLALRFSMDILHQSYIVVQRNKSTWNSHLTFPIIYDRRKDLWGMYVSSLSIVLVRSKEMKILGMLRGYLFHGAP